MSKFRSGRRSGSAWMIGAIALAAAAVLGAVTMSSCGSTAAAAGTGQALNAGPVDSITVSGEGKVTASPDEAVISVAVEKDAADAATALDTNSKAMQKVIGGLKAVGVTEAMIETSNVTVEPIRTYDPKTGKESTKAYRATNRVQVTLINMALVGKVITAATDSGANSITGPEWRLSENSPAVKKALEKAMANARGKAEVLAATAAVKLGEVIVVSESGTQTPPVVYDTKAFAMSSGSGTPPPVSPQGIGVTTSITVIYRMVR